MAPAIAERSLHGFHVFTRAHSIVLITPQGIPPRPCLTFLILNFRRWDLIKSTFRRSAAPLLGMMAACYAYAASTIPRAQRDEKMV